MSKPKNGKPVQESIHPQEPWPPEGQPEKSHISIKEARKGEKVTTVSRLGGVGIGYLLNGQVWKSTGSYFAVNAKSDVGGMKRFIRDGGAGYRKEVKRILGAE